MGVIWPSCWNKYVLLGVWRVWIVLKYGFGIIKVHFNFKHDVYVLVSGDGTVSIICFLDKFLAYSRHWWAEGGQVEMERVARGRNFLRSLMAYLIVVTSSSWMLMAVGSLPMGIYVVVVVTSVADRWCSAWGVHWVWRNSVVQVNRCVQRRNMECLIKASPLAVGAEGVRLTNWDWPTN